MTEDVQTGVDKLPSLSVFFPCHNEVGNIEELVRRMLDVLPDVAEHFEIIIVNDGSTDGTRELADRLAEEHPPVRAVHHEVNRGYGGALQSGFGAAQHEYIFLTDGDGQFDVREIPRLIEALDEADMAIGWRVKRTDSAIRTINAKVYMTMIRVLFGLKVRDIDCAFKLIPRKVIEAVDLVSTGALISAELLIRARKAGFTCAEVGVSHYPRLTGDQSGANLSVIMRMFRELWKLRGDLRSVRRT